MTIATTDMDDTWQQIQAAGGTFTLQLQRTPGQGGAGRVLIADANSAPADHDNCFVLAAEHDMLVFTFTTGIMAKGPAGSRVSCGS